jgi:HSP20 family protein
VDRHLAQDAFELADDARQLLAELDRDVPGVEPNSIRVAIRRSTLLIVGAKTTPAPDPEARYHLAERSHGRFARAVRLSGSVDAGRARGAIAAGELRIVLPRVDDRRGRMVLIPVEQG